MPETIDSEWLIKKFDGHRKMLASLGNVKFAPKAVVSMGKIIEDQINQFVNGLSETKRDAARRILLPKASDPWTYYGLIIKTAAQFDGESLRKQLMGLFACDN